ncbi:MAG: PQQ-binding-like beta-propeller repeat protein [Verrucomicrobia bacterium]|nr:PQQ-binding-like beta-propeller repeat protein [Verrucomicrobiota bacterium]
MADAQEARKNWSAAGEALRQLLDHETAAWLDVAAGGDPAGARLPGGRVLNRSVALQRLEQLVETHGRGAAGRGGTAAGRLLADAVKHYDTHALAEFIASQAPGELRKSAWLAQASWRFAARNYDEAAEMLLWFLRAEPKAARRGDAALGVALAGIRSARGALARHGLALMEALPPRTRLSFGGVNGTAAELRRTLSHDAPTVAGQGSEESVKSGQEVALLAGAGDLAGGKLFVEGRRFVRVAADGARVMWASAEVADKRGALDSSPAGAVLVDTVLLFRCSQLVALDAETGKLLWQERGVRLENLGETPRSDVFRRMVAMVGVSGRPMSPGWRTMFVAGSQLFRVKTSGEIASVSPRSGETVWSVRLPEAAVAWAAASVRESGRYLALVAAGGGNAAENRVAVLDIQHGRLLAVWDVPKDRPDFSVTADGRVQLAESGEAKSDDRK